MKFAKLSCLVILLVFLASTLLAPVASSSQDRIEQRVNELLARMTLDEKLGQLQQLDGEGNGNFRPEHLEMVR